VGIGPYEIVAPIGAGGMGRAYLARDTQLNPDHEMYWNECDGCKEISLYLGQ